MEKYLLTKIVILFFALFTSCTQNVNTTELESDLGMEPIWSTRLPGAAGIFNDGLVGLPVWGNKIIYHSTYTSKLNEEDNRIHFLDVETGQLDWSYPKEYNKEDQYFFWGIPYLSENLLVVKMPTFGTLVKNNKIIALSLNEKEVKWQITMPVPLSEFTTGDLCGDGQKVYFGQETTNTVRLYSADLQTGDTTCLYEFNSSSLYKGHELSSKIVYSENNGSKSLYFSILEWFQDENGNTDFENYFVSFNLELNKPQYVKYIPKTENYTINDFEIEEDKVFMTSGRNSYCIDINSADLHWNYYSNVYNDYLTTGVSIDENVLLLYGQNSLMGLNKNTGELIFKNNNVSCSTITLYQGVAYIVGRDGVLYYVEAETGEILKKIKCPESVGSLGTGFQTGCKPRIFNNRVYLFGNFNAFCYPAFSLIDQVN